MNIFQILGDQLHLLAIIILFFKIWKTRSCSGISGKSQILFAIVYITRYLDLFIVFISAYNVFMKMVFISTSLITVFLIHVKFKATYDHNHDTFRIEFLILPAFILALLINHELSFVEILWTFSIYLESVAILPQLFLVLKTGEVESIVNYYLFTLGSYRGLYLFNWAYRYYAEDHYDLIAIVAGLVQTVLFFFFFWPCLHSRPAEAGRDTKEGSAGETSQLRIEDGDLGYKKLETQNSEFPFSKNESIDLFFISEKPWYKDKGMLIPVFTTAQSKCDVLLGTNRNI